MTDEKVISLINDLAEQTAESEWFEFKRNHLSSQKVGEYLSALANSAALKGRRSGYLVFGVDNETHDVVGTSYDPYREKAKGNAELLHWLTRGMSPPVKVDVHMVNHPGGRVVVFEVSAATVQPVAFYGTEYVRIGTSTTKLKEHPELERSLWLRQIDWSAEILPNATMDDLDSTAIEKARLEFSEKNRAAHEEINAWDDATFLNKAKLTIRGGVTRTALLMLGKPESSVLLTPAVARISWILKDADNVEQDYEHFGPPLLLQVDRVLGKIRNLTIRSLPSGTLFPRELSQYDPWVIREALNNAVAHQDYRLAGRIVVVETPERLVVANRGHFLPESVEQVIRQDAPPEVYRNPFLVEAMVNLNMIDTQGGGIKRMFRTQVDRFFPLPDFDLSEPERVVVQVPGRILDEQYTLLLMERPDLALSEVMLLDRVQKGHSISHEEHQALRAKGLLEGRYPNAYLSASVAEVTDKKARHIRQRGFDNRYYRDLLEELISTHGPVSRREIDTLLLDKLPESLSADQKKNKVHNLLGGLVAAGRIVNEGSRAQPRWVATARISH